MPVKKSETVDTTNAWKFDQVIMSAVIFRVSKKLVTNPQAYYPEEF